MSKMGSHDPFVMTKIRVRNQIALLPPKCYESRSMPQLLILLLFSPFGFTIESIKEFKGASKVITCT